MLANILPLVDTNGFVKKLTLFLHGLALLQSPRTKYSVAWLVFVRFVTQICHKWSTAANSLKTLHPCDVRQEDPQLCTSQLWLNNTAATPSTTIKFNQSQSQQKPKTSTAMTTHDPRMNRTNPKYRELLGAPWYLKYLMCLSCYCLQLLWVFLECVLLPCACACLWPLSLKNPTTSKTPNMRPL
jgi:hypothetical protein